MAQAKEKKIVSNGNGPLKAPKKRVSPQELVKRKEERKVKFVDSAKASAKKIEDKQQQVNEKKKLNKENKVKDNKKASNEKAKLAKSTPISYYYNVSRDAYGNDIYCNVYQLLNDSRLGRIYQPQYFELSEQSSRIFEINDLLITHAIGVSLLYPDRKFVVQVSPRYLEDKDLTKRLELLLENAPGNLILSFNARPLVITGTPGKRRLEALVKKYNLTLMLDQLETERTSLLFEFPIKYARVDLRYYQEKDSSKTTFLKFMSDYCKSQNIVLCARYVNSKEQRTWVFANGIKYIEGDIVQKIKNNVSSAISEK